MSTLAYVIIVIVDLPIVYLTVNCIIAIYNKLWIKKKQR